MTAEKISYLLFLLLLLCTASCNTVDPPPDKTVLTLTLEDVSCTEAWIQLTTNNVQLPATLNLLKDNTITKTINLQTADSLLYIDSLLPNQTYQYQASSIQNPATSNELGVTTLDTTSHNFTFQTWTFGTIGSSSLYDVAIISENNIWCVGEIMVADSSPNGYTMYNAVHWDGNDWNLKRIFFPTVCGSSNLTSYPAKAIFAFDDGKIWISSSGDKMAILENGNQINKFCLPSNVSMSINKIWGTSSNDLYVVGNNGNIAHYNGSQWRKIESETDTDFKDIYATPDGKELWACGWTNRNGRVAIIKINENSIESIWDSQTNTKLSANYGGLLLNSLWANGNSEFVLGTGTIIRHSLLAKSIIKNDWIHYPNGSSLFRLGNYAYRIRGSNKNNIAVAGDAAMIWHFNGKSWHKFEEIYNQEDRLYGLAVTDNLIVAVGKSYTIGLGGALLLVGRR